MVASFIGGENWSTRRKPQTCRKLLTNFSTSCCIEYTLPWTGFELTTVVLIGTDCIGSCLFIYSSTIRSWPRWPPLIKKRKFKHCRDSQTRDVGPTNKSGNNRFGPEKHLFPPDRMSGIVPMLRMLNPFPMLGLKSWKERRDTDANESKQRYEEKRKDRQLNEKWKTGRPWLVFLENNTMACNVCINHYGKNLSGSRGQNTFISGCSNLKVLAVSDHERSKMHQWKIICQDRSKCQHKWSWQRSFILKRVWQV
jgi:hypothetical protein